MEKELICMRTNIGTPNEMKQQKLHEHQQDWIQSSSPITAPAFKLTLSDQIVSVTLGQN